MGAPKLLCYRGNARDGTQQLYFKSLQAQQGTSNTRDILLRRFSCQISAAPSPGTAAQKVASTLLPIDNSQELTRQLQPNISKRTKSSQLTIIMYEIICMIFLKPIPKPTKDGASIREATKAATNSSAGSSVTIQRFAYHFNGVGGHMQPITKMETVHPRGFSKVSVFFGSTVSRTTFTESFLANPLHHTALKPAFARAHSWAVATSPSLCNLDESPFPFFPPSVSNLLPLHVKLHQILFCLFLIFNLVCLLIFHASSVVCSPVRADMI